MFKRCLKINFLLNYDDSLEFIHYSHKNRKMIGVNKQKRPQVMIKNLDIP